MVWLSCLWLSSWLLIFAEGTFNDCPQSHGDHHVPMLSPPPSDTQSNATILVYTYSFGGYDHIRTDTIPRPGAVVDAVFITDSSSSNIRYWQRAGWRILSVPIEELAPHHQVVSAQRLAAKRVKFALGEVSSRLPRPMVVYDWVITFDSNMYVELSRLPAFLQQGNRSAAAAAILLDWRHWNPRSYETAWRFMTGEMGSMIDGNRLNFLTSEASRERARQWRDFLTEVHTKTPEFPRKYLDTSILMRNLRHVAYYSHVDVAFKAAYDTCHTIERDRK